MNATYSETTKQGKAELPLLQQATACLDEVIRSSSSSVDEVRAEWERGQDTKGRTLYTLRLSAWEESVSASFAPSELRDRRELKWRLRGLWEDLLELNSHTLLENLTKGNDGPEV